MMQHCPRCDTPKVPAAFSEGNAWCKDCRSVHRRAKYARNNELHPPKACAVCGKVKQYRSYMKGESVCETCRKKMSRDVSEAERKASEKARRGWETRRKAYAPPQTSRNGEVLRTCVECGRTDAIETFDGHVCAVCAPAVADILERCREDRLESPRIQCPGCGRYFTSYWQWDYCTHCEEVNDEETDVE